ncbi:MAG: hypothetical protein ACK47R_17995 [Planctomycetia bacterium]
MPFKYTMEFENEGPVHFITMTVQNCQIGDLLIATGFSGCHGVIVWAKNSRRAIIIHDTGPVGIDARDILQGFLNSAENDTFEGVITAYTNVYAATWMHQKKIKYQLKNIDSVKKSGSFIALKIGGTSPHNPESLTQQEENLNDGPERNFDIARQYKGSSGVFEVNRKGSKKWSKTKDKCERCGTVFKTNKTTGFGINFFRSGRHHCRNCGRSICEKCCGKFAKNKMWDATQANADVHIYCYICLPKQARRDKSNNLPWHL